MRGGGVNVPERETLKPMMGFFTILAEFAHMASKFDLSNTFNSQDFAFLIVFWLFFFQKKKRDLKHSNGIVKSQP